MTRRSSRDHGQRAPACGTSPSMPKKYPRHSNPRTAATLPPPLPLLQTTLLSCMQLCFLRHSPPGVPPSTRVTFQLFLDLPQRRSDATPHGLSPWSRVISIEHDPTCNPPNLLQTLSTPQHSRCSLMFPTSRAKPTKTRKQFILHILYPRPYEPITSSSTALSVRQNLQRPNRMLS
jgi:hypothetical protein